MGAAWEGVRRVMVMVMLILMAEDIGNDGKANEDAANAVANEFGGC